MVDQQNNPAPNRTTDQNAAPAATPQGDTRPLDQLELETLASLVRRPVDEDAFSQESACVQAVERIKQLGHEPLTDDLGPKAPESTLAPTQLGQYRLLDKLGEGGMGAVYRAMHQRLEKIVAVKILPAHRVPDPEAVARFTREMKAVGRLNHPNIVGAFDAGEVDGAHFLVMEMVEGLDVGAVCRQLGPLPIAAACEIVRQAAVGLSHAHACGLVHRDIKPSNLMLAAPFSPEGGAVGPEAAQAAQSITVKILDLGLARLGEQQAGGRELTSTGQMMGTFEYMAPEQGSDSHTVDHRADIYSLGATLYKLLTGHAPFGGEKYDTPLRRIMALATEDATPIRDLRPEVPKPLAKLLHRLLEKNPDRRVQSAGELAELLAPFADGRQLPDVLARALQATPGPTIAPPNSSTEPAASAAMEDTSPTAAASQLSPEQRDATAAIVLGPAARPRTRSSTWFPPRGPWLLAGAGGFAAIIVLGLLLSLRTPNGTLIIESDDPTAQVTVKQNGQIVDVASAESGWKLSLRDGKYDVELKGNSGDFRLAQNAITISQGDREVLRIHRSTNAEASSTAAKTTGRDLFGPPATSLEKQLVQGDLLSLIDVVKDTKSGVWERDGNELIAEGDAFCLLPVAVEGGYTLSGEMTWDSDKGEFRIILPVGLLRVTVNLKYDGQVSMAFVDGKSYPLRDKGRRLLESGERYEFEVIVERSGNDVKLVMLFDGRTECIWEGDHRRLSTVGHDLFRPALALTGKARIHALKIHSHSGKVAVLGPDRLVPCPFEMGAGGNIRNTHQAYFDLGPEGSLLVGLKFYCDGPIRRIRPVYRKDSEDVEEPIQYPAGGDVSVSLLARPGYAVGGIRAKFGDIIERLQVVFMRSLGNGWLDPFDTYTSETIGGFDGEPNITIGGDGRAIVGIYGEMNDYILNGIGVLHPLARSFPEQGTLEEKKAWVNAELRRLNPDLTERPTFTCEDGKIVGFVSHQDNGLVDVSPLQILKNLHSFCSGSDRLVDLTPLQGLPISTIDLSTAHRFADLSTLAGLPVRRLQCYQNAIKDLSPLRGLPLEHLAIRQAEVSDLSVLRELPLLKSLDIHYLHCGNKGGDIYVSQLKGLKLERLDCSFMPVTDLSPLEGMPLECLNLQRTRVTDLTPLRGMPLKSLVMTETPATDFSPLTQLPLEQLSCHISTAEQIANLRQIKTLKTINGRPAAEVLKEAEEKLKQPTPPKETASPQPFPEQGSVDEKKAWVVAELKRLNPEYEGNAAFQTEDGYIVGLDVDPPDRPVAISRIEPLAKLRHLQRLNVHKARERHRAADWTTS